MLDFQNISICRKGEKVLDHFNLKAPDGVILALLGEDKEAKSMLLKTASGGRKAGRRTDFIWMASLFMKKAGMLTVILDICQKNMAFIIF